MVAELSRNPTRPTTQSPPVMPGSELAVAVQLSASAMAAVAKAGVLQVSPAPFENTIITWPLMLGNALKRRTGVLSDPSCSFHQAETFTESRPEDCVTVPSANSTSSSQATSVMDAVRE